MNDLNIYSTDIDELDTFEAHFDYQIIPNGLILRYLNLGVSEHPLNPTTKLKYIDYSYLLFSKIVSIKGNFPTNLDLPNLESIELPNYFFGGTWIHDSRHREFSIICENTSLHLLVDSSMSDFKWEITSDKVLFLKNKQSM